MKADAPTNSLATHPGPHIRSPESGLIETPMTFKTSTTRLGAIVASGKGIMAILVLVICLGLPAVSGPFAEPGWLQEAMRGADGTVADSDAAVVVLHRTAEVKISKNGHAKTQFRSAYRILEPGRSDYQTLSENVGPFRKLKKLKGWLLSPDGSKETIGLDEALEIGVGGSAGYYIDDRLLIAGFSDVDKGSVVAFEYDIEEKGWDSCYQAFVFQVQQPVKFAQFSVTVPEGWTVHNWEWNTEGFAHQVSGKQHVWTARDLTYVPEEPLMPPWHYLSKVVAATCYERAGSRGVSFADWSSVACWCAGVHGPAAEPDELIVSQVAEITEGLNTDEEKLRALFEFVRDEIRYVAVELGKGRWEPRYATTTLRDRYGDCKDKTALLRAMLRSLGIDTAAVLAGVNRWVHPELPTPFQFNHCIVGIRLEGLEDLEAVPHAAVGGWLFCDPTDSSTPLGRLPTAVQGGPVLVASDVDSALVSLPYRRSSEWRRRCKMEAHLASTGAFSADITISDLGGRAYDMCHTRGITPEDKQIEAWQAVLSETVPGCRITDYRTGLDGDSAWVAFHLKADRYAVQADTLYLLKPDIFVSAGPPQFTAQHRVHPVWFGPPAQVHTEIVWHLPGGWAADLDTLTIRNACEAAGASCEISSRSSILRFNSSVSQNGRIVPVEDYNEARELDRDMTRIRSLTAFLRGSR